MLSRNPHATPWLSMCQSQSPSEQTGPSACRRASCRPAASVTRRTVAALTFKPARRYSSSAAAMKLSSRPATAIVARGRSLLPGESEVALHRRHREILGQVVESLEEAVRQADPLVQAELLRGARASLDRITGRAGVEDVLDLLFGRFCIGK